MGWTKDDIAGFRSGPKVAKMSSTAGRKFMEELSNLLQKHVSIVTSQGKTYVGTLTGVDTEHLSVCLTNAVNEKGIIEGSGPAAERVQRVFDEFIREKGIKVA